VGDSGVEPYPPKPNEILLLMEVYHMYLVGTYIPESDEGLYAELIRFHRSGEGELDDLPWKEVWEIEEDA
jgi:hypothetical protein